ncbi:MAG: SAM-dependent methyltransferase [Bacteroidota bacterium]
MNLGKLYLIPTFLAETNPSNVFPELNSSIIDGIKIFIVEDIRTARRFIKKLNPTRNIDELTFQVLDKHTKTEEYSSFLNAITTENIGLLSEAGCPCIADPGAVIVSLAHSKNIQVVPLIGPSSLLLALIASGFNGQNFAFHGYLPMDKNERIKKIKDLEKDIYTKQQTQIFIETPFRNTPLFLDILSNCKTDTKLCIAKDLTSAEELIITKSINNWKKSKQPDIQKVPTVFLLYK